MKIFNNLFFSETQKRISKRILLFTFLAFVSSFTLFGQAPAGYYDGANGKTGNDLKYSLYLIIKDHTVLSYDQLWTAFQYTDKKPNGKVWDMYSDIPGGTPPYEFTFSSDQCGNYGGESDCYNREHSFPKSWFSDASPMYSDLFHLYPTDGYVNGKRSNYPFGEVSSPSWTSLNGSRLGTCSYPGYSGTVFEPIDEYKGDFARSYFYMVTRYHNIVTGWNTDMLDGSQFPAFTSWAKSMLIEWHTQDPVSQKEIDRNNVIYNNYQHNRNPFIDNPEYVDLIWGTISVSFTSTPVTSAQAGIAYNYNITVAGKTGATFTITAPTKPSWLTLTSTGNGTATLTGTPSEGNVGNNSVVLNVTDGTSSKDQTFTINVSSSIVPLQFTSTPITTGQVGTVYTYNVSLTGNSGSTFSINATTKPSWLTLTTTGNGTATLTGTPTSGDAGANAVVLTGGDGTNSIEQSFSVNVTETSSGTSFIETFENIPADNSSYSNRSWTGDNSINWTATSSRTDQTINNRAICFSQSGTPTLESQTLTGGCSQIKFKHQQKFSGSGGIITLFVNNTEIGTTGVTADVQTSTFAVTGVAGDFVIKLVSNGATRIAIDDLEWQNPSSANSLPEITSIQISPSSPITGQTISVSANVSDSDGTVQSVVLEWGNNPSALSNSESTSVNENTYTAVIPSQDQVGIIYFKITATDNSAGIKTYSNSFEVGTNLAPTISNINQNPTNPTSSQNITITANISDPEGRLALAELNWGTSSNSLTNNSPMTNSASSYYAIIPSQAAGQNIYYQIKAKDTENNWAESSVLNFLVSDGTTNQLPTISSVSTSPNSPVTGQAITISSSITDSDGSVVKAILSWGNTTAANSNEMEMTANQNSYSATISAQSQIGTVYFKISAIDNSEDTSYYNLSVNVGANQLPVIDNIILNPTSPTSSQNITITANIYDPEGRLALAELNWGTSSNSLTNNTPMTNSASSYSAIIPSQAAGQNIYYQIKAKDAENNWAESSVLNFLVSDGTTNQLPTISSVSTSPNSPVTGQAITISSSITDSDGSVVKAILSWGNTTAANSNEMEMTANQNSYSATISAQSQTGTVYFKISAIDNSEDTSYYNLSVSIGVNQLPVISNISQNPTSPTSTDIVSISAQVVDPEGRLGTVLIQWGSASGALNSQVTMTSSNTTLSGSIPAQATGSNIYYRIKAFDTEGNQTFSDILNYTVSAASGIGDNGITGIKVYPNPFKETLNIDVETLGNTNVVIMDIIGKVLHTSEFYEKSQTINTNSLKAGIYIVKVINGGKTNIIRVVKR